MTNTVYRLKWKQKRKLKIYAILQKILSRLNISKHSRWHETHLAMGSLAVDMAKGTRTQFLVMITMQLIWFPRKGLCMGLERGLRLTTEYIFLCEWKTVYLTWMISLLMQIILGLSSFFLNNKRMLGPYLVSRSFIISTLSHPGQIQIRSKWLSLNVFDSHILALHYYPKKKKTLIFTDNVMTFAMTRGIT